MNLNRLIKITNQATKQGQVPFTIEAHVILMVNDHGKFNEIATLLELLHSGDFFKL